MLRACVQGTNAGLPYDEVAKSILVFGPGSIEQAHMADEWITLEQLALHRDVLRRWLMCEDEAPLDASAGCKL